MNKYGRKIIDTKHSIDRLSQRYSIQKSDVEKVVHNAIDKIIEEHNDVSTTYGVWSKSTNICVIIDWRKDYKSKDDSNQAIIVTLPPPKKDFSKFHTINKDDVKLIVEYFIQEYINKKVLKESCNRLVEVNFGPTSLFVEDGIIFDYGIDIYFKVD